VKARWDCRCADADQGIPFCPGGVRDSERARRVAPVSALIASREHRSAPSAGDLSAHCQATAHSTRGPNPWSWLSRHWAPWREVLVFVQPATVIAWQRKRFRYHWTRLSRSGKPGRPQISEEIRELIRNVSGTNPLWGAPRIVGELANLGINVAKSTVDKYRVRSGKAPSPTWKTFLKNHINDLVSIDFVIVPTIRFKLLYVFIVLAHSRRRVLHFNVTANPTAQWTAQQIVEAFPWDSAPKYLLRDRGAIYGGEFRKQIRAMGIEQVLSAPRSPWQNPFVERLIGTLRDRARARIASSFSRPDAMQVVEYPYGCVVREAVFLISAA
jgi:transposase InsO family protein